MSKMEKMGYSFIHAGIIISLLIACALIIMSAIYDWKLCTNKGGDYVRVPIGYKCINEVLPPEQNPGGAFAD